MDLSTAKMGGYVRAVNTSPGNKEYLRAYAESGFWWSYTPSRDCRLEVRGVAIQTYARLFRDLVDEGSPFHLEISNVRLDQGNYITAGYFLDDAHGSSANYGKSLNWVGPGSSYSGDGDHSDESFGGPWQAFYANGWADEDELVRNGNRSLEFAYRPTVSARGNVPVYCFIGAQSYVYADLDDVKATIRQGGTWQIERLSIWEV